MPIKLKTQKSKSKITIQKSKLYLFTLSLLLILALLLVNIYSSQTVSPLYNQFVNEKYEGTVSFLKTIRNTPLFSYLLQTNINIFGNQLERDVFAEENLKKQEIKDLEIVLQRNPKARDVLIKLSVLYHELGDKIKAEEYLKQAKDLDPSVGL